MSDPQPLRAVLRIRNNRIMRAREVLGHTSAASACRASGLGPTRWSDLESMKVSPLNKDGTLNQAALQMSDFLGEEPDYLWPDVVIEYRGPRLAHREFSPPATPLLEASVNTPEQLMLRAEAENEIDEALNTSSLTPRERQVIELRYFGDETGVTQTLEAAGRHLEVTRERIRQIECKALRKLRGSAGFRIVERTGTLRVIAKL